MNLQHQLQSYLKTLYLGGFLQSLDLRLKEAQTSSLGYMEFLQLLVQDEVERREDKKLNLVSSVPPSKKKRLLKVLISLSIQNSMPNPFKILETWHEGDVIMAKAAGVELAYIPYKGGAPATLACLQGEVDVVGSGLHEHIEFIKAGKLRSLAVFTDKPITAEGITFEPVTKYLPQLKNVPFGGSIMLGVKRDTPLDVLKKIHNAYLKAAEEPRFEDTLKKKVITKTILSPFEADRMAAFNESTTSWTFKEIGIAKIDPAELGIPRLEEFDKWWPPKDYEPRLT